MLGAPRETSLREPWLLEGGVNGRNPSRLPAGADWVAPRCGSILLEPMFDEPMFDEPMFDEPRLLRSELAGLDERVLLLGGVNGRYPPRLPF